MVRYWKLVGVVLAVAILAVSPMAAHIEEGIYHARVIPNYQNRVLAHISSEEVPRFGDLAFMAEKQPAARENLLQFLLVNVRLDEDAAADQAFIKID